MVTWSEIITEVVEIDEAPGHGIPQQFLYHATFERYLPSIKKAGLGGASIQRNFDISSGGTIYLCDHPDVAEAYAQIAAERTGFDDQIRILEINTSQLDHTKFVPDDNDEDVSYRVDFGGDEEDEDNEDAQPTDRWHSWGYKGVIPYAALKVYY